MTKKKSASKQKTKPAPKLEPTYVYFERLQSAVGELAIGSGTIQERLHDALRSMAMLPWNASDPYITEGLKFIRGFFTPRGPVDVDATNLAWKVLKDMSDRTAVKAAREIFGLYRYVLEHKDSE